MAAGADLAILARMSRVDRLTSTTAQLLGKLDLARRAHSFAPCGRQHVDTTGMGSAYPSRHNDRSFERCQRL